MKLHLKHKDSSKIMSAIHRVLPDFVEIEDFCNMTVWKLCWVATEDPDQAIKDITLLAYGSDLPGLVLSTGLLTLVGDGDCPNCGSNDAEFDYWMAHCKTCDFEWLPMMHSVIIDGIAYKN